MEVNPKFYSKFLEIYGASKPDDTPMVVHFRNWLINKVQTNIGKLPDD